MLFLGPAGDVPPAWWSQPQCSDDQGIAVVFTPHVLSSCFLKSRYFSILECSFLRSLGTARIYPLCPAGPPSLFFFCLPVCIFSPAFLRPWLPVMLRLFFWYSFSTSAVSRGPLLILTVYWYSLILSVSSWVVALVLSAPPPSSASWCRSWYLGSGFSLSLLGQFMGCLLPHQQQLSHLLFYCLLSLIGGCSRAM